MASRAENNTNTRSLYKYAALPTPSKDTMNSNSDLNGNSSYLHEIKAQLNSTSDQLYTSFASPSVPGDDRSNNILVQQREMDTRSFYIPNSDLESPESPDFEGDEFRGAFGQNFPLKTRHIVGSRNFFHEDSVANSGDRGLVDIFDAGWNSTLSAQTQRRQQRSQGQAQQNASKANIFAGNRDTTSSAKILIGTSALSARPPPGFPPSNDEHGGGWFTQSEPHWSGNNTSHLSRSAPFSTSAVVGTNLGPLRPINPHNLSINSRQSNLPQRFSRHGSQQSQPLQPHQMGARGLGYLHRGSAPLQSYQNPRFIPHRSYPMAAGVVSRSASEVQNNQGPSLSGSSFHQYENPNHSSSDPQGRPLFLGMQGRTFRPDAQSVGRFPKLRDARHASKPISWTLNASDTAPPPTNSRALKKRDSRIGLNNKPGLKAKERTQFTHEEIDAVVASVVGSDWVQEYADEIDKMKEANQKVAEERKEATRKRNEAEKEAKHLERDANSAESNRLLKKLAVSNHEEKAATRGTKRAAENDTLSAPPSKKSRRLDLQQWQLNEEDKGSISADCNVTSLDSGANSFQGLCNKPRLPDTGAKVHGDGPNGNRPAVRNSSNKNSNFTDEYGMTSSSSDPLDIDQSYSGEPQVTVADPDPYTQNFNGFYIYGTNADGIEYNYEGYPQLDASDPNAEKNLYSQNARDGTLFGINNIQTHAQLSIPEASGESQNSPATEPSFRGDISAHLGYSGTFFNDQTWSDPNFSNLERNADANSNFANHDVNNGLFLNTPTGQTATRQTSRHINSCLTTETGDDGNSTILPDMVLEEGVAKLNNHRVLYHNENEEFVD